MPDNILTARGLTAVVLSLFQKRHPELPLLSEVSNGLDEFDVVVRRNVANRATALDPCECGISRAVVPAVPGALDAFTLKGVAYVLFETQEGEGQVVKYIHNGSGVVDAVDNGDRMTVDAAVRLSPPPASRQVGAQTRERKANPSYTRGPQTAEWIAKRTESITSGTGVRRIREAARQVAA